MDDFGEPGFHIPHLIMNTMIALGVWAGIIWTVRRFW